MFEPKNRKMYYNIDYSVPDIPIWLCKTSFKIGRPWHCFNHFTFQTFEFNVPWEQIRDCSLDISVMDFDTIGRNEMIGRLMLGCEYLSIRRMELFISGHFSAWNSSGPQETNQWAEMIAKPRQSTVIWHRWGQHILQTFISSLFFRLRAAEWKLIEDPKNEMISYHWFYFSLDCLCIV